MTQNGCVFIVIFILICLSFNYTFPLHRGVDEDILKGSIYGNLSRKCDSYNIHGHEGGTSHLEALRKAIRKLRQSTREIGANIQDRVGGKYKSLEENNIFNDDDLRQYEQLVIMKKYPYLDLKEFEQKYSSLFAKASRQNVKLEAGDNIEGEPSIYEAPIEGPSVEIINRGLTGFSIPSQRKEIAIAENEVKNNLEPGYKHDNGKIKTFSDIGEKLNNEAGH